MSVAEHDYPVWYYVEGGATQGPVPVQVIRSLVGSGRLGPYDHVRHIGWGNWWRLYEAADTLGLTGAPAPVVQQPTPTPTQQPMPTPQPQPTPQAATVPMPQTPIPQPAPPQVAAMPTPVNQPGVAPAMAYAAAAATTYDPMAMAGLAPGAVVADTGPAASRLARTVAWIIDLTVLVMILVVSNLLFEFAPVASLITVSMTLAYLVVLPAAGFIRLGHLVTGLRIVDAESLKSPHPQAQAARGLVLLLLAVPMLAGALGSVFNVYLSTRRVAWHDAVTGTLVVRRR